MNRLWSRARSASPTHLWNRFTQPRRLRTAGRAADAYLVSFPKSGRTWLRYILSHYFNITHDFGVDVDLYSMFGIVPNFALDSERGVSGFRYAGTMPLIAVSHFPYDRKLFDKTPTVFLVRDPRDVLVSSYFHATRHKHRYSGSIEDFLDSDQGIPALSTYLNGWSHGLPGHPHLVVSYEALTADTVSAVADILRFLDCEIDWVALAEAVRLSDFATMRRGEQQTGIPGHDYDRADNEALRMRRGAVGGFSEYLSEQAVKHIETRLSRSLSPGAKSLLMLTGFGASDTPLTTVRDMGGISDPAVKRYTDGPALC